MARRWLAPAKLNLYLHVTGQRADGYHLLDSLVAFAAIGDEIIAEPAASLTLEVTGPQAPALAPAACDNLVWRAAQLLADHAGRTPAAALTLVKNLPVASGIGGGSSDAAATLRALVALWRLEIGEATLAALGARLGADLPVCLRQRVSWLGGIGERIEEATPLPPVTALLANPGVGLPTAAVFKGLRGSFSTPARFAAMPADAAALARVIGERRNDLVDAAIALVPAIGDVLDRLSALEGALIARMSGSGATCFALFATAAAAATAAARLRAERPGWWIATGELF
jgi:4-diphosphocytidyl-2-C-methyl-D-erythritol kinase